jgi:hypothetical protein
MVTEREMLIEVKYHLEEDIKAWMSINKTLGVPEAYEEAEKDRALIRKIDKVI